MVIRPEVKGGLYVLAIAIIVLSVTVGFSWLSWQNRTARQVDTLLKVIDKQSTQLQAQDKLISDLDARLRAYEEIKPSDLKVAINVVGQIIANAQRQQQMQQGGKR